MYRFWFEIYELILSSNLEDMENTIFATLPYVYISVMHCDKTAFGSWKLTIYDKQQYFQNLIGTERGFNSIDVKQINLMYVCSVNHHSFFTTPTADCYDTNSICPSVAAQGQCNNNSWKNTHAR